jgi:hypothetical protein
VGQAVTAAAALALALALVLALVLQSAWRRAAPAAQGLSVASFTERLEGVVRGL